MGLILLVKTDPMGKDLDNLGIGTGSIGSTETSIYGVISSDCFIATRLHSFLITNRELELKISSLLVCLERRKRKQRVLGGDREGDVDISANTCSNKGRRGKSQEYGG